MPRGVVGGAGCGAARTGGTAAPRVSAATLAPARCLDDDPARAAAAAAAATAAAAAAATAADAQLYFAPTDARVWCALDSRTPALGLSLLAVDAALLREARVWTTPPPPPPPATDAPGQAHERWLRSAAIAALARTACFPEIHFGIANFSEMHILMAPFPRLFDLIWIRAIRGPGRRRAVAEVEAEAAAEAPVCGPAAGGGGAAARGWRRGGGGGGTRDTVLGLAPRDLWRAPSVPPPPPPAAAALAAAAAARAGPLARAWERAADGGRRMRDNGGRRRAMLDAPPPPPGGALPRGVNGFVTGAARTALLFGPEAAALDICISPCAPVAVGGDGGEGAGGRPARRRPQSAPVSRCW